MARPTTAKRWISLLAILTISLAMACGGSEFADMTEARGEHGATLLQDGKLLVAGGRESRALKSAELLDVATGEWAATGSLTTARFAHTQTMLKNGKVLVVGTSKPEIYNPASGTWSETGDMVNVRVEGHTATLLEDGRVLVTGGVSEINGTKRTTALAEVYDPEANTWSAIPDMLEARTKHRAVKLSDNTVLVVGATSADIYDPAANTWTSAGTLPTDHLELFSAILLPDGRAMVTGGGTRGLRVTQDVVLANVSIYDPASGEWSSAGEMNKKAWKHTSTVLKDGKVLVIGFVTAEIYDPGANTWTVLGDLDNSRFGGHTATLLDDGRVLIVGGSNIKYTATGQIGGREGIGTIRVYDPALEW